MDWSFKFFINSILLGLGLAMDAFSVSLANGLNEPLMKNKKVLGIAGVFSFFQCVMPLMGWFLVSTVAQYFTVFYKIIPFISLVLLGFIGGKMLYEGIKSKEQVNATCSIGFKGLIVQGVATSIDALSVGFTIAGYIWIQALVCCLLIGVITYIICVTGILIGKKAGTKLSNKAGIFGGVILIIIGLEIFITSWF